MCKVMKESRKSVLFGAMRDDSVRFDRMRARVHEKNRTKLWCSVKVYIDNGKSLWYNHNWYVAVCEKLQNTYVVIVQNNGARRRGERAFKSGSCILWVLTDGKSSAFRDFAVIFVETNENGCPPIDLLVKYGIIIVGCSGRSNLLGRMELEFDQMR